MNLGRITLGNMKDVENAVKQGKKVCVVYDRESSAYVRNIMLNPSEEEKEILELIGGKIANVELPNEKYADALEMYAHYDQKDGFVPSACYIANNKTPSLSFCPEDSLKHPAKYLALLQINFDEVYLL